MITKLKITNYGPINDELLLDFSQSSKEVEEGSFIVDNNRISKINCFVGKNGVGKSAIIDALEVIKNIVSNKNYRASIFLGSDIFRNHHTDVYWPNVHSDLDYTEIYVEIFKNGKVFQYTARLERRKISLEILKCKKIQPNARFSQVFKRNANKLNQKNFFENGSALASGLLSENLDVKDFKDCIRSIYILRAGSKPNNDINKLITSLSDQVNSGKVKGFSDFKKYKEKVIDKLFKSIDCGLSEIDFITKLREIHDTSTENIKIYRKNTIKPKISVNDILQSNHYIKISTGTYRFIALLLAALKAKNEQSILVVDEFGTQFHPELAEIIFDIFSSEAPSSEQIIFNTNQLALMENLHWSQMQILDNLGYGTTVRKLKRAHDHNRSIYKNFRQGAYYGAPSVDLALLSEALEEK